MHLTSINFLNSKFKKKVDSMMFTQEKQQASLPKFEGKSDVRKIPEHSSQDAQFICNSSNQSLKPKRLCLTNLPIQMCTIHALLI